jgi:hypothetical protein
VPVRWTRGLEGTQVLREGPDVPAHGPRRRLTAGDEHGAVAARRDEGVGHLDAVEHAVAGVLDVHHGAAELEPRRDDVRRGRLDHVLARRREHQQVDLLRGRPRLGEQLARGGDGEVGRLLAAGHHVPGPDARQPVQHPGGRGVRADPRLNLGAGQAVLRQVHGDSGQPRSHHYGLPVSVICNDS